jgi:hypothetical protein
MPAAYPLPSDLSPATVANTASLLRIVALALISGAAIASRLFAVINFESIIHELYVLNISFQPIFSGPDTFLCSAIHGLTSESLCPVYPTNAHRATVVQRECSRRKASMFVLDHEFTNCATELGM